MAKAGAVGANEAIIDAGIDSVEFNVYYYDAFVSVLHDLFVNREKRNTARKITA